jgi:tetratricopeptide (TPR) repeat protein
MMSMSLNPYSYCPCGSGKKVKFCCRELAGEIEKIERMLEAEQRQACLEYVESLCKRYPQHPYLQATRSALLMASGRLDEADELLGELVHAHPRNPMVLGHAVLLVAQREDQQLQTAIELLQRAAELLGESCPPVLLDAIGFVVQRAFDEGYYQACRAHLMLLKSWTGAHDQIDRLLASFQSNENVPVQLRDALAWRTVPDEHPCAPELAAARARFERGCFRQAERLLTELTQRHAEVPAVWRNLAMLRGALADLPGERAALRTYAQLPQLSWDDAVEAESLALLIDRECSEPDVPCWSCEFPIRDWERALQGLIDDRRAVPLDVRQLDPEQHGGVRPRAGFDILDRPPAAEGAAADDEAAPHLLGQVLLFGRETDREPRIVNYSWGDEKLAAARSTLQTILGDAIAEPRPPEAITSLPFYTALWSDIPYSGGAADGQQRRRPLDEHYRRTLQQVWPDRPLRQLDGKSPRQAVEDAGLRRRVAAILLQLQLDAPPQIRAEDIDVVRQQLGLPVPEPIGRHQLESLPSEWTSRETMRLAAQRAASAGKLCLFELSVAQLHRLRLPELDNLELAFVVQRLMELHCVPLLSAASRELLARPDVAEVVSPVHLSMLAIRSMSPSEAFELIDQMRQRFQQPGKCDAPWDLLELDTCFRADDHERAGEVFKHLRRHHWEEPAVREHIARLLQMMRAASSDRGEPVAAAEVAGSAETANQKLWTPDSEPTRSPSGLWLPD